MASKIEGDVSFKAMGASWTMRFSGAALLALEEAFPGKVWTDVLGEFAAAAKAKTMLPMTTVAKVTQAALKRHHPSVSLEDAAELAMMPEAQTALGQAMTLAFPTATEAGDDAGQGPRKRQRGTGTAR